MNFSASWLRHSGALESHVGNLAVGSCLLNSSEGQQPAKTVLTHLLLLLYLLQESFVCFAAEICQAPQKGPFSSVQVYSGL